MRRVCLLTGASGVLGTAFISHFAETYEIIGVHHQHPVAFASQDQETFDPVSLSKQSEPAPIWTVRADLADDAAVGRLVTAIADRVRNIDLLVNCAAIREWHPLLTPAAMRSAPAVLAVNVLGPLRLSAAVAQTFWLHDIDANVTARRNVVNVSSTAGLFVYPDLGQALYATSKAALNHLTYHMASEFWDIGVRVNAVASDTFPGRVPTKEVLDAIAALDSGKDTGQIVQLPQSPGASQ